MGKKGRGATNLKDLVESGILNAGRNKLIVVFKGITYTASLEADGLIAYQGTLLLCRWTATLGGASQDEVEDLSTDFSELLVPIPAPKDCHSKLFLSLMM